MADEKKVELNEENLDDVAGGAMSGKDILAIAAGAVAGGVAAYQGYHQTKKLLDKADGTAKGGGDSGGSGITNTIGGTNNKSFQQGNSNAVGNSANVRL